MWHSYTQHLYAIEGVPGIALATASKIQIELSLQGVGYFLFLDARH